MPSVYWVSGDAIPDKFLERCWSRLTIKTCSARRTDEIEIMALPPVQTSLACCLALAAVIGLSAPSRRAAAGRGRVQPRHSADPLRYLLPLPRPRQGQAQGRLCVWTPRKAPSPTWAMARQSSPASPARAKSFTASPRPTRRKRMPPADARPAARPNARSSWCAAGSSRERNGRSTGRSSRRSGPRCPRVKDAKWPRNPIDAFHPRPAGTARACGRRRRPTASR